MGLLSGQGPVLSSSNTGEGGEGSRGRACRAGASAQQLRRALENRESKAQGLSQCLDSRRRKILLSSTRAWHEPRGTKPLNLHKSSDVQSPPSTAAFVPVPSDDFQSANVIFLDSRHPIFQTVVVFRQELNFFPSVSAIRRPFTEPVNSLICRAVFNTLQPLSVIYV